MKLRKAIEDGYFSKDPVEVWASAAYKTLRLARRALRSVPVKDYQPGMLEVLEAVEDVLRVTKKEVPE